MNNLEKITKLKAGEAITCTVHGNSMMPRINNGDTVVVTPIPDVSTIEKGDVVFCKVRDRFFFHLVKGKRFSKNQNKLMFLIGNNHGHDNGWTTLVFGKVEA